MIQETSNVQIWKDFFGNPLKEGDIILYTAWSGGGLQTGIFYGVGLSNDNFVRLKIRFFAMKHKYCHPDPSRPYHRKVESTYPSYGHSTIECRRGRQSCQDNLEVILIENPLYRMDNEGVVLCLRAREFLEEAKFKKIKKKVIKKD